MQNSISQELVDKITEEFYVEETTRNSVDHVMPAFENVSEGTKQTLRDNTRAFLNLVVPAMLTEGWTPPADTDSDPEPDPDLDNLRSEANEHGMLDIDQAEELFHYVDQLQQQLRNERVTSMAAAIILHDVREAGYSVEAECDKGGCETKIDRGLGYLCGDNSDRLRSVDGFESGKYFCDQHEAHHDCTNPKCGNYFADESLCCTKVKK